jgi:hypothetical protein
MQLVRGLLLLFVCLLITVSGLAGEKTLTNADVVKLANLGLGDDAVIAKVRQAPTISFKLEMEDLGGLKAAGVSGKVIAAMLDRASGDAGGVMATSAPAQNSKAVREPEYLGNFFWLDSASGNLNPLERQTPMHKIKVKAMGYGGGEGYFEVPGETSPVRFKEGQNLEFVVLVATQQSDPQEIIRLFSWRGERGVRRLTIDKAGSMGLSSKYLMNQSQVPLNATKYGKSSFKVASTEVLPPGEYTLSAPGTEDRFCFGVDPDPTHAASGLERIVPFRTKEVIPLGIVRGLISIDSIEVSGFPKAKELQKAEGSQSDATKLTVVLTYSNHDNRDWKGQYVVTVLDEKGEEIGAGQRDVSLDEGEKGDTHRLSVTMRTIDFPRAAKLRVRVVARPD